METPFVTLHPTKSTRVKTLALVALAVIGTLAVCHLVLNSTSTTETETLLIQDAHVNSLYHHWKRNHSKNFNNAEDRVRAQIFHETHKKIEEHNANPDHTWKMGYGPFAGLTEEEFAAIQFVQDDYHRERKSDPHRVVHHEEVSTVHQNETHHTHHVEHHTHHHNGTRVSHHTRTHHHPNGTQIVHHNTTHFHGHNGSAVHSNKTHVNHGVSQSKTIFKHHNVTRRTLKNDSHEVDTETVHTVHHNGTHTHNHTHREVNNGEGIEFVQKNHTHTHPNGSQVHSNSTFKNIPKNDHTLHINESHVIHPNGTHAVEENTTEHHHNGTTVHHQKLTHFSKDGEVEFILNILFPPKPATPTAPSWVVDWTTKGAIGSVKNQGGCGSCYAFAAADAIESALALAGKGLPSISEQQIVDCVRIHGLNGCNGGGIPGALIYNIDNGYVTDKEYPYVAQTQTCKATGGPYKIKSWTPTSPQNNVETLKANLKKTPLVIGLWVEGWQNYQSGVLPRCNADSGMHAVQLVGVTTDGVWKLRNQWGTGWGEAGYIRLAAGDTCKVTRDSMWATA